MASVVISVATFNILPNKAARWNWSSSPLIDTAEQFCGPTKARKIAGYLGSNYVVESSRGHIRDLPRGGRSPEAPTTD